MAISKLKKALFRFWRIIQLKKGVYCKYGRGCQFKKGVQADEKTSIGNYTYVGRYTTITEATVGSYCSIAPFATIGPGDHVLDSASTSERINELNPMRSAELTSKPISIGNDVWIGTNTVILRGTTIGDGAVIAAGAVVTKDVPPYAIVGGVPARVIRFRVNPKKGDQLRKSRWWDYSPTEAYSMLKTNKML